MNVLVVAVGAMLCAAVVVCLWRLVRGPALLDRVVALDMLVAVLVCGLASAAAYTRNSTTVPVIVALAFVGFVGSATVARFLTEEQE